MRVVYALILLLMFAAPTPLRAGGAVGNAADDGIPGWADIRPIFELRCINCHAEHGASKGLRLDSYAAAMAGGETGPVLVAGDPAGSELVRRIRGESTPRMPFLSRPLPEAELDLIVRWVAGGLREAGD